MEDLKELATIAALLVGYMLVWTVTLVLATIVVYATGHLILGVW